MLVRLFIVSWADKVSDSAKLGDLGRVSIPVKMLSQEGKGNKLGELGGLRCNVLSFKVHGINYKMNDS